MGTSRKRVVPGRSRPEWDSLKGELIDARAWPTRAGAGRAVVEYIGWYEACGARKRQCLSARLASPYRGRKGSGSGRASEGRQWTARTAREKGSRMAQIVLDQAGGRLHFFDPSSGADIGRALTRSGGA